MVARITTAAFQGIVVQPVDGQVHISAGLPSFTIVSPIKPNRYCEIAGYKPLQILKRALLILWALVTLSACSIGDKSPGFVAWSLSPDGEKLGYTRCIMNQIDCRISSYEFGTNRVTSYRGPIVGFWDYPRYSPDGEFLVIALKKRDDPTRQIISINIDGSRFEPLTSGFKSRSEPSFSEDGVLLVYRCSELKKRTHRPFWGVVGSHVHLQSLCIFNLNTGRETKITHINDQSFGAPLFLPGGQHVLYTRQPIDFGGRAERKSLITNIATKETTQVSFPDLPINRFELSADGKTMAFTAVPDQMRGLKPAGKWGRSELYVWKGDGNWPHPKGEVRQLTHGGTYQSGFALSADGSTLVYALDESRRGNMTFYRLDLDTDKLTTFVLPRGVDRWIDVDVPPTNSSQPSGS